MSKKNRAGPRDVRYYFHQARLEEGEKARCVIVFVHGLRDHASAHAFFFEQLTCEKCHVLSFDLLSHDFSLGERYSVEDYRQNVLVVWQSIIHALREHIPQRTPIVIMGYSYGFSLVVHALKALIGKYRSIDNIIHRRVALVVGLSPAFKVGHTVPSILRFLGPVLGFLSRYVGNIPILPMDLSQITDDESILKVIETDPKVFKGRINVQTAHNVHIAGKTALRLLPTIKLPFLLVFGNQDFVLPVTEKDIADIENIEVRIITGSKHNIFDGNNLHAGRTLECIMRSLEKYC